MSTGFFWWPVFLTQWELLAPQYRRGKVGLAWPLGQPSVIFRAAFINEISREAISPVVGDSEILFTFSWRLVYPAVARSLSMSGPERLALGDWRDPQVSLRQAC